MRAASTVSIFFVIFLLCIPTDKSLAQYNEKKVIKKAKSITIIVDGEINKEKPLVVSELSQDPMSLTSVFRDELRFNKYNVVSDAVSKNSINIDEEGKKSNSGSTEMYASKEINATYVVNITYKGDYTLLLDTYVALIEGELIDLSNGGNILASFRMEMKGVVSSIDLIRFVVDKINKKESFRK